MAPDKVTHEDLRKVEDRQADFRHEQNKFFQNMFTDLDAKFDKLNDEVSELKRVTAVSNKSLEIIVHELEQFKDVFIKHMDREERLIADLAHSADDKYAAKWAQYVVAFILTGIGTAVLGSLMALIIQK